MTDLRVIKRRILEEDKLENLYEAMGCDHIKIMRNRIEASLPDHFHSDNKRSVQTKLTESLSSSVRNRGFSGDIFGLVSFIMHNKTSEKEIQDDLYNAKKFICETLGYTEFLSGGGYVARTDYLAHMKEIIKGKKRKRKIKPNPTLPEEVLDDYLIYPYQDWIDEGIPYNIQVLFGIGFDLQTRRVVMPMRNRFGKLVGVKGRIIDDNESDLKYMYLYRYNNSQELYGLHLALPHIISEKKVYVFEGEKSVMKMFANGVYNCVAIGSSDMSDIQAELIKRLGIDIEIVICYDSDKLPMKSFDPEDIVIEKLPRELIVIVEEFFPNRKVHAILDLDRKLEEKSSPIDSGIDVFKSLEQENCYELSVGA